MKLARSAGGDCGVATLHLEGGGIIFVTLGFVEAGGGGVIAVLAEAMHPAIIHIATLNSDVLRRSWWSRVGMTAAATVAGRGVTHGSLHCLQ